MNSFDLLEWTTNFTGETIVAFILSLARWLTGEGTPGWVSLVLVVALVVLLLWYKIITGRFLCAVQSVRRILQVDGNEKITQERLVGIDQKLGSEAAKGGFYRRLETAWREFSETALAPPTDTGVLRNTARPSIFFNREDLGLERGIWRQVPALFVSIGLLLTFLGLVAALEQTGQVLKPDGTSVAATVSSLTTLLNVASAKFIMSLTGLACSIVFTILLRVWTNKKDDALQHLCADIEHGCSFMSEQDMLREMLEQAKEQTAHFQAFSTELVAQIAQPLKEDLPNAIRKSVGEAMQPLIDNISRGTHQGIESLVGSVSGQLVEGIEGSVREMTTLMESIGMRLKEAAGQLERSSETVTGNVHEAAGSLVERIERLSSGIEASTARLGNFAEAIEASATIVISASEQLCRSSEALSEATGPVRDSISDIQASTEAMKGTFERTEAILHHTHEVIEHSHAAVQDVLRALDGSVTEFKDVIGRYREIDDNLGEAFNKIETGLRVSIKEIGAFEQKVNEEFARALNRLETVIAQAEPFIPVPEE